jgi:hypothetical protein
MEAAAKDGGDREAGKMAGRRLTREELRLVRHYLREGKTEDKLATAARKTNITLEKAQALLKRTHVAEELERQWLIIGAEQSELAAAKDGGDREAGKMAGRRRISEEVKAKVRAEYGTMSNEALARKYGTNGVRIAYICRDLAKPERRKAGKAIRAAESKAGLEAALKRDQQSTAAEEALATLKVPASALDRMWSGLDLDNKARAIQYLVSEGMV